MAINYKRELNPQQHAVVTQAEGPCLVLAGAGTGKTRTLIYRVAYLLEKGIPASNILLVTFTNKAARQMQERLIKLLGTHHLPWSGTFHHIGNRILRRYAKAIGFTPRFGILDQDDAKKLLETCMESLDLTQQGRVPIPKPSVIHSILSFAANSRRRITDVVEERYGSLVPYTEEIVKIHQRYQKQKHQTNVMDFDDLLLKWLLLLASDEPARLELQDQFRYILVDEYQDTNLIQAEIIRWLAAKHQNVLVVGDDAQSIYAFRGAQIRNILDFPKQYTNTKTFSLEQNYRSTQPILDLANAILQQNFEQFPKTLFTQKKSGDRPWVIELEDSRQQSLFVARQVQLAVEEEGIPLNEIAVLFRARYQAARLELDLTKRGIPYLVRGGLRFFEQAHIKDVVAWLKILVNPKDSIAWMRVFSLMPGIGPKSAFKLWEILAKEPDPLARILKKGESLGLDGKAQKGLEELRGLLRQISPLGVKPEAPLSHLIQEWYLPQLQSIYRDAIERAEDLQQLLDLAARYDSLTEFVADVSLQEGFKGERVDEKNGRNRLVLSTIHQAKGLEWDIVFILSLCTGQFPHSKVEEESLEMEEERRLFYVAATRARNRLYLLYPKAEYHRQWDTLIYQDSLFLTELPSELYQRQEISLVTVT